MRWEPARAFYLITCVHGLHYLGDKLAVLSRAAGWLTAAGRLAADLDLASIRLADGRPAGRALAARLRAAEIHAARVTACTRPQNTPTSVSWRTRALRGAGGSTFRQRLPAGHQSAGYLPTVMAMRRKGTLS
jgi:hypothetical protein